MGKNQKEEEEGRRGGAAASLRYIWWRMHQKQKVRGEMRQGKGQERREGWEEKETEDRKVEGDGVGSSSVFVLLLSVNE